MFNVVYFAQRNFNNMSGQIDANPTKDFFISILVRDISLKDAIGDLVDNCVDGAKRLRGENNYSGLEIDISTYPNGFRIKDNCGGINLEVAKKYAFRFGRPENMKDTDFSIGQFGIGMKRALFKLGNSFEVSSKTKDDYFKMAVDVQKWKKTEDWNFDFVNNGINNPKLKVQDTGTEITVSNLLNESKAAFDPKSGFIEELHNDLELDQLYNINKGLKILLNGNPVKSKKLNLLLSDSLKVGNWEKAYGKGRNAVNVKLVVGIGPQDEQAGGWYIFCNKRLIVGPDTSKMTGWTGKKGDGVANYHHQYRRFRGFAYFDAKDSANLPWNTTKTGMNVDSPIYKDVRLQMIEMMKVVINGFLNYLKIERESDYAGEMVLHEAIDEAKQINLTDDVKLKTYYSDSRSFSYPAPDKPNKKLAPGETNIRYKMNKDKVNKVKKSLGVNTVGEVGIGTFEYYYENEIED